MQLARGRRRCWWSCGLTAVAPT